MTNEVLFETRGKDDVVLLGSDIFWIAPDTADTMSKKKVTCGSGQYLIGVTVERVRRSSNESHNATERTSILFSGFLPGFQNGSIQMIRLSE